MYTLFLVFSILAVVLAPVLIDLFLSFREAQYHLQSFRSEQKKGPQVAWASPRPR